MPCLKTGCTPTDPYIWALSLEVITSASCSGLEGLPHHEHAAPGEGCVSSFHFGGAEEPCIFLLRLSQPTPAALSECLTWLRSPTTWSLAGSCTKCPTTATSSHAPTSEMPREPAAWPHISGSGHWPCLSAFQPLCPTSLHSYQISLIFCVCHWRSPSRPQSPPPAQTPTRSAPPQRHLLPLMLYLDSASLCPCFAPMVGPGVKVHGSLGWKGALLRGGAWQ